jgi:hypothetical protein
MHHKIYDVLNSQRSCQHVLAGILVRKYSTINTSPTRWIKTVHSTTTVITQHRPNNFNIQDFNNHTLLTYTYSNYIALTEIVIVIVME